MKIQEANEKADGKPVYVYRSGLSLIQNADIILVVNDGDVVQQGTHES